MLGGDAPVGYNHLVLSPINLSPVDRTVTGQLRLTSTTNPEMPVIQGALSILLGPGTLEVRVEQLDFYRKLALSAGQITAVQGWINTAQNNIEAGLITVGVINGTQSTGA